MSRPLKRFARDENGAALAEFALIFPVMMLMFGVAVEGARTYHSYQSAVTGVRDAARYLSRVVRSDVCITGASLTDWDEALTKIVREDQSENSLFSPGVTIQSVTSTLECVPGDWRAEGAAPIASITATLHITYPFSGLFAFAGSTLKPVTTTITDTARIVGS